ncbi:MAG: WD40 repeat domain-containing protein [Candidatus Poribacteria bacterium]|nr:WD40 repeat domain-containing protein [Candidatus Poribacteria bacterium]
MKNIFATKNRYILILLALIFVSTFYLPILFAESPSPKGEAKANFDTGRIYDVAYSPDGTRLAVANSEGIWIYDATTYQLLRLVKSRRTGVHLIVFSPDGSTIASEEELSRIHLWDVNTGKHKYELERGSWIRTFDFSADGETFLTVGVHGAFTFWDTATGVKKQQIIKPKEFINSYCSVFDPNNLILAVSNLHATIDLYDPVKGVVKKTLTGHKRGCHRIAFSPDGKTLASGSDDADLRDEDGNFRRDSGNLHVWDTVKGELKHKISVEGMYGIYSIAFSPDGSLLAGGDEFGNIHLVNPNTGEYKKKFEGHDGLVPAIAFSSDMRTFASGSRDGTVRIWDVASGENKRILY